MNKFSHDPEEGSCAAAAQDGVTAWALPIIPTYSGTEPAGNRPRMNALLTARPAASSSPSAPALRSRSVRARQRLAAVRRPAIRGLLSRAPVRGRRPLQEGQESDEYDPHAVHSPPPHPRAGWWLRSQLVLDLAAGFPLEGHADGLLDQRAEVEQARTGEISRLIVAADYRSLAPSASRSSRSGSSATSTTSACGWASLHLAVAAMEEAARAAPPAPRISVPAPRRSHQLLRRGGALRRHAGVDAGRVREHSRLRADLSRWGSAPRTATSA